MTKRTGKGGDQISLPGMNPHTWDNLIRQPTLVDASVYIIAEWRTKRDGRREVKIYRPYDKTKSAIYTAATKEEAIKICISVDDHGGDFSKAKKSGFKQAEEEHWEEAKRRAEQEERARESENVRRVLHCSVGDVNSRGKIAKLTDDQLAYCLATEKRATCR